MPITGGKPSRPTTTNRKKKSAPPMTAAMALMPSQSATRRSPGLPARASRFAVRSANEALVTRATVPDNWAASGRRVRSRNGDWSSSSSRFFACMDPSWVRRAWTGSTGEPPARPRTMSRMAPAAAKAMTMAIGSDLDVDDLADEHEPDEHHETAEGQDDDPGRKAEDAGRVLEHRIHEVGSCKEEEAGQGDRQEADHVARQALLRGEGADLALDPDALTDRERDGVQDLGEVATDGVLDGDGGGHQLEVVRAHTPDHVLERRLERQAEVDLADDPPEFGRDG